VFGEPRPAAADYALAALWSASASAAPGALWTDSSGWRLGTAAVSRWRFGEREVTIELVASEATARAPQYRARLDDADYEMRLIARHEGSLEVELQGSRERLQVVASGPTLELFRAGRHVTLRLSSTEDALQPTAEADAGSLVTPLPGTVVAVHVSAGQSVARGAPLLTIEAMKMEHTIAAPYAGTVERLPFGLGDRVAAGSVLAELKPQH
jgi:3-methylcrotonyl-CoA carboxylase alpha subunit